MGLTLHLENNKYPHSDVSMRYFMFHRCSDALCEDASDSQKLKVWSNHSDSVGWSVGDINILLPVVKELLTPTFKENHPDEIDFIEDIVYLFEVALKVNCPIVFSG